MNANVMFIHCRKVRTVTSIPIVSSVRSLRDAARESVVRFCTNRKLRGELGFTLYFGVACQHKVESPSPNLKRAQVVPRQTLFARS
jgi:hypothetical protein